MGERGDAGGRRDPFYSCRVWAGLGRERRSVLFPRRPGGFGKGAASGRVSRAGHPSARIIILFCLLLRCFSGPVFIVHAFFLWLPRALEIFFVCFLLVLFLYLFLLYHINTKINSKSTITDR